jgi:hypothetical protein
VIVPSACKVLDECPVRLVSQFELSPIRRRIQLKSYWATFFYYLDSYSEPGKQNIIAKDEIGVIVLG